MEPPAGSGVHSGVRQDLTSSHDDDELLQSSVSPKLFCPCWNIFGGYFIKVPVFYSIFKKWHLSLVVLS